MNHPSNRPPVSSLEPTAENWQDEQTPELSENHYIWLIETKSRHLVYFHWPTATMSLKLSIFVRFLGHLVVDLWVLALPVRYQRSESIFY